jgi:hypothetical protein
VKGKQRHFDRESEREGGEQPELPVARISGGRAVLHRTQHHRVVERVEVIIERNDADEHQETANRRVEEELDRRVDAFLAAPDADQEIHRHERRLKEEIEEEQIKRHEDADHRAF